MKKRRQTSSVDPASDAVAEAVRIERAHIEEEQRKLIERAARAAAPFDGVLGTLPPPFSAADQAKHAAARDWLLENVSFAHGKAISRLTAADLHRLIAEFERTGVPPAVLMRRDDRDAFVDLASICLAARAGSDQGLRMRGDEYHADAEINRRETEHRAQRAEQLAAKAAPILKQRAKFGRTGATANRKIGKENRVKILAAARNILAKRERRPLTARELERLVAEETQIPLGTVRGHIGKLRKEKILA